MKKNEFTWPKLLRSERFWAMILAAVSVYVEAKGFIGAEERNLIATILTAFVGIRTIDRASEVVAEKK